MANFRYLFHDPVDKEKKVIFLSFLKNKRSKEPQRKVFHWLAFVQCSFPGPMTVSEERQVGCSY